MPLFSRNRIHERRRRTYASPKPPHRERRDVLVSGGTSTGKATPLHELADHPRLIAPDDTPEVALAADDVVHPRTTLAVDLAAPPRQGLRMRPDRVAPGEARGPEAPEPVRAVSTRRDGTPATARARRSPTSRDRGRRLAET